MSKLSRVALVALVVVGMAAASSGCSYNRFVTQEEAVKTQWAQVENQLQRRNDLIPNLVESTKGFAQQERDVFTAIADSRAQAWLALRRPSRRSRPPTSRRRPWPACSSWSRTTRNCARARRSLD